MTRLVAMILLIAAAAAAAIAANVALLSYGSSNNDPVGKLRQVAHLPPAPLTSCARRPARSSTSTRTTNGCAFTATVFGDRADVPGGALAKT
jgi:hypothetical protein